MAEKPVDALFDNFSATGDVGGDKCPQLAAYGLTAADVPELAAAAAKASSTRANPIDLEQGEIEAAIYAAL